MHERADVAYGEIIRPQTRYKERSSSYFPRKPRTSHSTVFASTQADSAKSCDLSREMVRYERGAGRGGCCPRYLDEHETGFQAIEAARLQFAATCQARQILSLCAPRLASPDTSWRPTRRGKPRGAPARTVHSEARKPCATKG